MPTQECSVCGKEMKLRKCKSAAGFYLGYICPNDGPYSRETMYMCEETADDLLMSLSGGGDG